MADVGLLLPDFLLIALGFVICRTTALDRPVWDATERLVYWLLFPVLLFGAIVRSPLDPARTLTLAALGLCTVALGVAIAHALGHWPGVDRHRHASGAQTAFRFNSYVGLALADRLAGPDGVAAIALLIALCVPLCNVAAVWALARHGGQAFGRELVRNPLIVATVAGLAANLAGLQLPQLATTAVERIGAAALPLGLMAVGAGLQLGGLRGGWPLATALLSVRHAVLPAFAIAAAVALALPPVQALVLVAFAALPTASSAYVLAARMGGDGPYVAGLVTLSTLLGMVSVPLALAALGVLSG
jgi:malonate transporter and related proteins